MGILERQKSILLKAMNLYKSRNKTIRPFEDGNIKPSNFPHNATESESEPELEQELEPESPEDSIKERVKLKGRTKSEKSADRETIKQEQDLKY